MSKQVLLVDDDHYTVNLFKNLFRNRRETLQVAQDVASARRFFKEYDYNLILMDQRLPDGMGLDLIRELRQERPNQIAVIITGYADIRDAVSAVREGLFDYLQKPFDDLEALENSIDKALELDRAYREIDSLRRTLDEQGDNKHRMIGHSQVIEQLILQIKQVAALDTTVLLEGESGTGKELAARMLHTYSPRANKPFLEVNCGALSEQLLESTLFGYEKGAFTGAAKTTPGYLEQVDGGTLFLDEIIDMSPKLQCSLLRVLQERSFQRLGGSSLRTSDFRLVCACNRTLSEEVSEKHFREDLYYRINVVSLRIPPLREHRKDILELSLYFLDLFNQKFKKEVGPFTSEAIDFLEKYSWPGNVRQLRHAIERIVALQSAGPITTFHLEHLTPVKENNDRTESDAVLSYSEERASFEHSYLQRLLNVAKGNISEAARISGIARQNLYERMKRWKS